MTAAENAATARRSAAMWATVAAKHGAGSPEEREADKAFHAALDALLAQAETAGLELQVANQEHELRVAAEAERDALLAQAEAGAGYAGGMAMSTMAVLQVKLDAAEAERDAAVQAAQEARFALRTAEAAMLKDRQDVRAAEQAAEQAQEALRRIADLDGTVVEARQIARAALTGDGTAPPPAPVDIEPAEEFKIYPDGTVPS